MVFLILAASLGGVLMAELDCYCDKDSKYIKLFWNKKWVAGLVGFIVVILIGVLPFYVGSKLNREYVTKETTQIESMRNTLGIKGTIFWGGGSISSYQDYYGYKKGPDGGYTIVQVPSYQSTIFQDQTGDTGYIIKTIKESRMPKNWMAFFFINTRFPPEPTYSVSYEIHVPEDSILLEFSFK
jgi:hypothetical protein